MTNTDINNIEDTAMAFAITETRKIMEKDGVPVEEQDRIIASAITDAKAREAGAKPGRSMAENAADAMLDSARGNVAWTKLERVDLQEAYVLFAAMISVMKTLEKTGKVEDPELLAKIFLSLLGNTVENMGA